MVIIKHWKYFMGKFSKKKKQNYQLKLKFVKRIRVYIQNSMVVVTFSIFNKKQSFLVDLVHKIKTPV